jgi:lipopolysaccharide transport system ATP-binding protein
MSNDAAISVSHLSKTYRILRRDERYFTEAVFNRLLHPLKAKRREELCALDDVSFEVPWGETLGILGRNGAGKSTLLKILTRITAPTKGRVELGGRVGSLLEVGTGFHPELTGRENVYLNGTLLGMKRREIQRRFDEIVAFSGVERFLDTQVKRYSTGMYVRLAFAVAAHLETEILAIDEVLAVGDADFQSKCLRKLREVAQEGKTVLLVSHQLQTVSALCSSAVYLEHGRLICYGNVEEALEEYKASFERFQSSPLEAARRPGNGEVRFTEARASKFAYDAAEDKQIEFSISPMVPLHTRYWISADVRDADGVVVAQCDSRLVDFWLEKDEEASGILTIRTPWLRPGPYTVDLFAWTPERADVWEGAVAFEVVPVLPYRAIAPPEALRKGVVLAEFDYKKC